MCAVVGQVVAVVAWCSLSTGPHRFKFQTTDFGLFLVLQVSCMLEHLCTSWCSSKPRHAVYTAWSPLNPLTRLLAWWLSRGMKTQGIDHSPGSRHDAIMQTSSCSQYFRMFPKVSAIFLRQQPMWNCNFWLSGPQLSEDPWRRRPPEHRGDDWSGGFGGWRGRGVDDTCWCGSALQVIKSFQSTLTQRVYDSLCFLYLFISFFVLYSDNFYDIMILNDFFEIPNTLAMENAARLTPGGAFGRCTPAARCAAGRLGGRQPGPHRDARPPSWQWHSWNRSHWPREQSFNTATWTLVEFAGGG